jgi:hypothetical protein
LLLFNEPLRLFIDRWGILDLFGLLLMKHLHVVVDLHDALFLLFHLVLKELLRIPVFLLLTSIVLIGTFRPLRGESTSFKLLYLFLLKELGQTLALTVFLLLDPLLELLNIEPFVLDNRGLH